MFWKVGIAEEEESEVVKCLLGFELVSCDNDDADRDFWCTVTNLVLLLDLV